MTAAHRTLTTPPTVQQPASGQFSQLDPLPITNRQPPIIESGPFRSEPPVPSTTRSNYSSRQDYANSYVQSSRLQALHLPFLPPYQTPEEVSCSCSTSRASSARCQYSHFQHSPEHYSHHHFHSQWQRRKSHHLPTDSVQAEATRTPARAVRYQDC